MSTPSATPRRPSRLNSPRRSSGRPPARCCVGAARDGGSAFSIDALWRAERVVVEVDGRNGHRSWAQTVRDRRRDLTLRGVGITVLRYVWDQLEYEPALVEADLARALHLA